MCVYIYTYICTTVYIILYYSVIKIIKFCHLQQCQWNQRILYLVKKKKKDQRKKNTLSYHLHLELKRQNKHMYMAKQKQIDRHRVPLVTCGRGSEGQDTGLELTDTNHLCKQKQHGSNYTTQSDRAIIL